MGETSAPWEGGLLFRLPLGFFPTPLAQKNYSTQEAPLYIYYIKKITMATSKLDTLHVSVGNLSTAPYQRPFTCSLSPVVLFSVLDHFLRRDEGQEKVVGALLGARSPDGTEVEIRNAFSIIYSEEHSEIKLDKEHYANMFELHQRVNPEESILGWYSAGPALSPSNAPFHTVFGQDTAPFRPIHITFDTDMLVKSDDLGMRAFTR